MLNEVHYHLGIDIGSTTVKGVLFFSEKDQNKILWKCYERHETRQAEKALEFLKELELLFPAVFFPGSNKVSIHITGSGGNNLKDLIGAHFYQEVSCLSAAVEKIYPHAKSIIELGGQDAKIIIYKEDKKTGIKKKIMTMNDKCAGGTGAVIDKISAKLQLKSDDLSRIKYRNSKIYPVAGKCGVFAETDINGLQKQGVNSIELMASLFEAIVQQNLSVLTRGNTLLPSVLLLGGPNFFIPALREAWEENLLRLWNERGINLSAFENIQDAVFTPEDGNYFAAMGAIYQGIKDRLTREKLEYRGTSYLEDYIKSRESRLLNGGKPFFVGNEKAEFIKKYIPPQWHPYKFKKGSSVKAYIGIDSGSTSTKGVMISPEGEVIAVDYMLSKGNPIEDAKKILANLQSQVVEDKSDLTILGVGTTGYGKDMLKEVLLADVAVVETVAHTLAAKHYYPEVDVIVDVGGQDIKLILLKDGIVKDFKLNTQCSAGNGYFLQNTAETFGYSVEEFADVAFTATKSARFGYGCAVFLQTDIVDFQRQGWEAPEILAGLAQVLPKNIWQYVASIPNLESIGKTYVLQGGTQKNIAAVKSQVDYIIEKFNHTEVNPDIHVHRFTSVCGAIGAALEALSVVSDKTSFIGFAETESIEYSSLYGEDTRCNFCRNKCIRTFIDVETKMMKRRLIIAPCEKGRLEDIDDVKKIQKENSKLKVKNPNLISLANKKVWEVNSNSSRRFSELLNKKSGNKNRQEKPDHNLIKREDVKIGFPRVLNHYVLQPFFNTYFDTLGFNPQNFYYSQYTNEEMYRKGSKRGSVDPCFPAKVSLSHVSDLLDRYGNDLNYIVFPMINTFSTGIENLWENKACPTVAGTPEMVYSAFTKEKDIFRDSKVEFLKPFLNFAEPGVLEKELYREWSKVFGFTAEENKVAVRAGYYALKKYKNNLQSQGRKLIEMVEKEKRLALVLLGRAYHSDPGINHSIFELFMEKGYPVIPISSIPMDKKFLSRYFSPGEVDANNMLSIDDVWKHSFSSSSTLKIWASKVIARIPNLIPIELSSFKCGHDSTLFSTIEKIFESASKPFFSFKDIDENNPGGAIRIRVETIDYFLKKYNTAIYEHNKKEIIDLVNV